MISCKIINRLAVRIVFTLLFLLWVGIPILKSQYYFGRNKIQYNQFQWHILKTQHFDIYYYPEMESLAEIGAHFAEEAYKHLQNKYNHTILNRIPLVFYSSHFHFEETNTLPYMIPQGLGGFFEFIKGRVVVPSDGSLSSFRHTIHHELVHVFQHSYINSILKNRKNRHSKTFPLWFTEGLAEYWSEGWDTNAEMILRDVVLNNTVVPLQYLNRIHGSYLMYKEGQSILKYIAETYGDEKIRRIHQNLWKGRTFSETLKISLGKNIKELNEEWLYALKKSYYPLLAKHDFPRMTSVRITEKGFNTLPAYFRYDDQDMVIFVANRDGYSSIYIKPIVDYRQHRPKILLKGERTAELESFHLQQSRMDVNQRGELAFIAKSGPRDILYILDIHEKKIIRQYQWEDLVSLFSPSWSPDCISIAVTGLNKAGQSDLYLIDSIKNRKTRLTSDYYNDQDPDWSPDGDYLVFSSDRTEAGRHGNMNLFLYHIQTSSIHYLTFGPYEDLHPCWSPDGHFIVFSSDRDGVSNLWIIEKGSRLQSDQESAPVYSLYEKKETITKQPKLKQLTRFTTGAYYPCWTDSTNLLFTAFENYGFQIRFMNNVTDLLDSIQEIPCDPIQKDSVMYMFPRITSMTQSRKVRYKRKFSLDFAQSQVVQDPLFGTSGGGELIISDMLGDEKYYFLLYNTAQTRSDFWDGFNIAATRVDLSRRINFALGLYRLAGLYFNYYDGYFFERRYGGFGAVSYPLNKFERVETSINFRHSDKSWYNTTSSRKALLLSNFISYTMDNALWGPTGPLDGNRYNITLGNTVDTWRSNVNFTTIIFDLRKYFRIGYRIAHALRLRGQFNHGKEPLPFYMGGSWDLRGYKLWSLWGTKLFLISNELRFPFLDQFYLRFPFGGVGFSSIRGALFLDAGNVWTTGFDEIKGSFGLGLRLRLGGYLVLRLDIGKKTNFKTIAPKTFTQFFFGWDF